jgi:hypothetical protein
MTVSATQGQSQAVKENEYTKFIVDSLAKGTRPVYVSANAGQYAPLLDILLEDYNPHDLDEFTLVLEALKNKHKAFNTLLTFPGSEMGSHPDFTITPDGKQIFKTLSVVDVMHQPDVEWLVSGILQRATTTLVVGTGNVGKTFVWLDVCFDIALGDKWLGRRTRQGPVLYIYAEGRGGLKQRIHAILKERGKIDTAGNLTETIDTISFIPRPVHLLNEKQALFDTIEAMPNPPEEVVIDTFSMCASGVEENSNSQVAQFLETATTLKLKYGCHVTIIHHMNKSGGFRGASALRDNVDTQVILDRDDDTSPIKMTCGKQKDGPYFSPILLQLKVMDLGINSYTLEPITSCVVVEAGEDSSNATEKRMPEKQIKMLEILAIHGSLTSSLWQKRCLEEADIPKTTFNRNLDTLVSSGKVQKTEYTSGKQLRISYSLPKDNEEWSQN